MQQVTLKILAEDINSTKYHESSNCAITRALHRAGYPDLIDNGIYIAKESNFAAVDGSAAYYQMSRIVKAMYNFSYRKRGIMEIESELFEEPQDFEVTLNLNI